ncbi:vWA domain-containing protein [Clostridium sp. HCP1S3_B4]|uniref:vWA domain-containing protein n=1 Tax=unclassified Clostridium TaxID=2614128 RepID=UPI002A78F231|nr:VWA domain-containing protein [Clostridiales bacterium]MDY2730637.1 VWA domain-containing protein [Clostridium sp.]
MEFIKGQRVKLKDILKGNILKINCNITGNFKEDMDVCLFGVDENDNISDDRYFVFYNQLLSPYDAIRKESNKDTFYIDFSKIPQDIKKVVLCVSIDSNINTMSNINNGFVDFYDDNSKIGTFNVTAKDYSSEKSIILCEIYIKDNLWRLNLIASGFFGGLSDILKNYGGEVAEENNNNNMSNNLPLSTKDNEKKVVLEKKEKIKKVVLEKAPRLIDLTKKATVVLEKKHIDNVLASVVLVLDNSGSMDWQYKNGDVQRALDKLLPVALMFDDDGVLDCWAFASKCKRLSEITLDNIDDYLNNEGKGWRKWIEGRWNNEPVVMKEIIKTYKDNSIPTYIVFISDGGVSESAKIKKLLREASDYPIFWQFVGIGGRNYGILQELDVIDGRTVDNANFFSIDNINALSDEELYEKLLNEFPMWLKAAREKNILK